MPFLGTSRLKSEMAVTTFLRLNHEIRKSLPRLRIEMATSGGGTGTSSFFLRLPQHPPLDGFLASCILRSHRAPSTGHTKIAI